MHVFVGFFCLFFTHRDFVKKNLLRAFEEKSECKTYMPTTLGVFCLIPSSRTIPCATFALLVSGGLQIFIIFIQYRATFSQDAFLLQFLARLTRNFFWWCMINDNCLRQCNRGDGWITDPAKWLQFRARKAYNMYIVSWRMFLEQYRW